MQCQRVQQSGADVARHSYRLASSMYQLPGHRGNRSLAVGASDRQHLRLVALRLAQVIERLGEHN